MDKLLTTMEEYAAKRQIPVIEPDIAALLATTVANRKPSAILEIGTAIGYSALIMANQMPQAARITTIENSVSNAAMASRFISMSPFADRIDIRVGEAKDLLPLLVDRYDMLFIDAAKGQYLNFLRLVLDKLADEAVIFADDVFYHGWVQSSNPPRRLKTIVERMREYLAFVSTDRRFVTTVYNIGDGVAISQYREETKLETD